MSHPDLVSSLLGDESVAAEVSLGGEDALYVTPSRTLVYRADGLLSDESVDQYSHDAERIAVSEGRRKSKITLDYGLDGKKRFAVPTKRLDDALHPVVAGVFNATGITDEGETVKRTFRFSELTVVVTSARIVKHIGPSVWDADFEEFHYDDVTDLTFEEGSVATSVVVAMGDRQERFKAPNDDARAVRESLKAALLAYHDEPNLPAFRKARSAEDADADADADAEATGGSVDFGDGPDPLSAEPAADAEAEAEAHPNASADAAATGGGSAAPSAGGSPSAEAESAPRAGGADAGNANGSRSPAESGSGSVAAVAGADDADSPTADGASSARESASVEGDADGDADEFGGSGFRSAGPVDEADVASELAELTAAVEAQNEELRKQRRTFETLVEELRRGR